MSDGPVLLFDLDGCIVDSLPSIVRCWHATLPEFGLRAPPDAVIRAHVGPPVHQAAASFAPGADPALIARIVAAYRARSARATDVQPFPGVPELLADLHAQGAVLGIATSKSLEVVAPLLDRLDLRRLFSAVEGTRVDELGTDKATVVARAVAALAPQRPSLLVGDREHDVHGAHANRLAAVGVLWGYGSRAELEAAGADAVVATSAQLRDHLSAAVDL